MKTKEQYLTDLNSGRSTLGSVENEFIEQYPKDYKELIFSYARKNSFNLIFTHPKYISTHPQDCEDIFLTLCLESPERLDNLPSLFSDKYPDRYKNIILKLIAEKHNVLRFMHMDIKKHLEDYKNILKISIENFGFDNCKNTIHDQYAPLDPEGYEKLIISINRLSSFDFAFITDIYMMSHPESYQRIAQHFINHGINVVAYIGHQYIESFPKMFKEIAIATIKSNPENIASLENYYSRLPTNIIQDHPEIQELIIENFLEKNIHLKPLWEKIKNIETQADDLKTRDEETAATVASNLFKNLRYKLCVYCNTPNPDVATKSQLIQACKQETRIARPVLEKHRGWQQFFLNFASILIDAFSFGAVPLALGRWQLFKAKTKSEQQLDEVDDFLAQENALQ